MYGCMDVYICRNEKRGEKDGWRPADFEFGHLHIQYLTYTKHAHIHNLYNRELENFREGEIKEMIDIYVERGMEPDDAEVRKTKKMITRI